MRSSDLVAYTPEDPEVMEMVDRGLKFLEASNTSLGRNDRSTYGPGVYVLKAYAHHKVMHNRSVDVVKRGIAQAIAFADKFSGKPDIDSRSKGIYEAAVSILLLSDVDPYEYKPQILSLQEFLYQSQYPNGAFGYPGSDTGDVSQVQYAMLALWTLQHAEFKTDPKRVTGCIDWLNRVQDPGGAWPYQGVDPGPGKPLVKQTSEVGMSMALAGGSAGLIGGDILGMWGDTIDNSADKAYPGMPKAVKIPKEIERVKNVPANSKSRTVSAIKRCEQYRSQTPFERHHWYYYQLYTLERYESFLEIAFGNDPAESPAWYNRGVESLKETQSPEGAWGMSDIDPDRTRAENSTAFAILFLIRSTQRSIMSASTGNLAGGRELPGDTTDIRVDGTKIRGRPAAAAVGDMLDLLEDDRGDLEGKSIPDDLQLAADPAQRRAQIDRLIRLVRGSQSWQARRVAARLLGKSEEMRVVPALIFALSDGDQSVRRFARDGLRFISRKFEGFGLADDPTKAEVEEVQEQWRQWYLKVNPKYVFLD